MKIYNVEIIELNGKKVISVDGFVLYNELQLIKQKVGDISKYSVGTKLKIKVAV